VHRRPNWASITVEKNANCLGRLKACVRKLGQIVSNKHLRADNGLFDLDAGVTIHDCTPAPAADPEEVTGVLLRADPG